MKDSQSDYPAKPGQPTSKDRFQEFQHCWRHPSSRSWYLAYIVSCASSTRSSHGTFSFKKQRVSFL
ncbi:hypothetical protein DPMN_184397 [Dreissena polymorpha]|uniref:Uncharacterized protein n=1 Tax=Dreissena polymorpha TaxID=45954 RepID=A0A9D4DHU3_DREPO|nr:hypothetical protein DPMN_184397 [Dreissena polymorpha]